MNITTIKHEVSLAYFVHYKIVMDDNLRWFSMFYPEDKAQVPLAYSIPKVKVIASTNKTYSDKLPLFEINMLHVTVYDDSVFSIIEPWLLEYEKKTNKVVNVELHTTDLKVLK